MNPHKTFAKVSIRQTGTPYALPALSGEQVQTARNLFQSGFGLFRFLDERHLFRRPCPSNLAHYFTHGLSKTTETLRSALFIYVMWTFLPLNSTSTTDSNETTS